MKRQEEEGKVKRCGDINHFFIFLLDELCGFVEWMF